MHLTMMKLQKCIFSGCHIMTLKLSSILETEEIGGFLQFFLLKLVQPHKRTNLKVFSTLMMILPFSWFGEGKCSASGSSGSVRSLSWKTSCSIWAITFCCLGSQCSSMDSTTGYLPKGIQMNAECYVYNAQW